MAPGAVVNDDLDDYGIDDLGVDPFAESGDENANNAESQSKKRKEPTGLGIEEAVAVSKKARVPRVKLDENRLLSDKGIPKLRRKAGDLKFKGKGHEFSDIARLLSFYQLWLDDLFPKAKFLDAAAMVEKAGHKARMRMARMEWIDEGKPKATADPDDDDADLFGEPEGREPAKFPARVAPIFQNNTRASERPKTPSIDDLFGGDDLYDATPKAARNAKAATDTNGQGNDEPDDFEDLDALMAEEEAQRPASKSLFGNGADMDDLDALMAEAEAEGSVPAAPSRAKSDKPLVISDEGADADEEEAMAEMDGLW